MYSLRVILHSPVIPVSNYLSSLRSLCCFHSHTWKLGHLHGNTYSGAAWERNGYPGMFSLLSTAINGPCKFVNSLRCLSGVFLSLPHGISNKGEIAFPSKTKISAVTRVDDRTFPQQFEAHYWASNVRGGFHVHLDVNIIIVLQRQKEERDGNSHSYLLFISIQKGKQACLPFRRFFLQTELIFKILLF